MHEGMAESKRRGEPPPGMIEYAYGVDCGVCGRWYDSYAFYGRPWHRLFRGHWPHPETPSEYQKRIGWTDA